MRAVMVGAVKAEAAATRARRMQARCMSNRWRARVGAKHVIFSFTRNIQST